MRSQNGDKDDSDEANEKDDDKDGSKDGEDGQQLKHMGSYADFKIADRHVQKSQVHKGKKKTERQEKRCLAAHEGSGLMTKAYKNTR